MTFGDLINQIIGLLLITIPVVASLALLSFFWGLAKFIFNMSGDEKVVADGKNLMLWGILALFVMVSIWGILRFVYGELGFTQFGLPLLPQ